MDRGIACSSKICAKKEHARKQEQHKQKIRSVRPSVDTSEPRTFQLAHIHGNLKKEQLLEERYAEIDRQNRILLQKMSNIMKQPPTAPGPATTPRDGRSASAGPASLNKDARKRELLRITRENQMILKRIQQAQPVYNHVEWEGLDRRNQAYLRNLAEYPLVLRSARGGPSEMLRLDGGEDRGGPASARGPATERPPLVGQVRVEEVNRIVLQETTPIGGSPWLVEMRTDGRLLQIFAAPDEDTRAPLELVVDEKSHRRLFMEADGNYSRLAQKLQVIGRRLVLDEQVPVAVAAAPQALPELVPQQAWSTPREEPKEERRAAEKPPEKPQERLPPAPPPAAPPPAAPPPVAPVAPAAPAPRTKRPTPTSSSRPAAAATAAARPMSSKSGKSLGTEEDDELDAAGLVVPLTRGSVRAEVNIAWDPPGSAELADVRVCLRGLTPTPDSAAAVSTRTYDLLANDGTSSVVS